MSQTKLHQWGFKRKVEETSVLPINPVDQQEGKCDKVHSLRQDSQSHSEMVSLKKAMQLWGKLKVSTYNVESLSDDRIRSITMQMELNNTSVLLVQGTRSKWVYDRIEGQYKWFFQPSGSSGPDQYSGVCIVVSVALLSNCRVNKIPILDSRALCIRIKSRFMDIAFLAAHAPGDQLPRPKRTQFWNTLISEINKLPKRTAVILGIDANGHVGRDPSGGIGAASTEYWTENGQSLQELSDSCRLCALNTQNSCKNPKWTWQKKGWFYPVED